MTLNPLKWWNDRKAEQNRQRALDGKTTSGHLTPGDRAHMFRSRRKV